MEIRLGKAHRRKALSCCMVVHPGRGVAFGNPRLRLGGVMVVVVLVLLSFIAAGVAELFVVVNVVVVAVSRVVVVVAFM